MDWLIDGPRFTAQFVDSSCGGSLSRRVYALPASIYIVKRRKIKRS